jgi:hypothetical protein
LISFPNIKTGCRFNIIADNKTPVDNEFSLVWNEEVPYDNPENEIRMIRSSNQVE